MRILIATPPFSIPPRGACEHDRILGIQQLRRLGHEVYVVSFLLSWQDRAVIEAAKDYLGCQATFTPYRPVPYTTGSGLRSRLTGFLECPALLDGSALVYWKAALLNCYRDILNNWLPDVAWFDYTNLWPLIRIADAAGVPTIVRSINYEPRHNLDERGRSLINYVRYFAKFLSERESIRRATVFAAITPADREQYLQMGRADCAVLPLRGLPGWIRPPRRSLPKSTLDVFFFGSNYTVPHNLAALKLITERIVPEVRRHAEGSFVFHLLGGKMPPELAAQVPSDIRVHGYVDDLETFFRDMDMALIPSLCGGGMQQKIFEPLCRAFPVVVSKRGLAGYPVVSGTHAWTADDVSGLVKGILAMRDSSLRERLSCGAHHFASEYFSAALMDKIVSDLLDRAAVHGRCAA